MINLQTQVMNLILVKPKFLTSVHPETVDFGSGQGLSVFATAGIVRYSEDCKKAPVPSKPWRSRKNDALGQKMPFPDGHQSCDSDQEDE